MVLNDQHSSQRDVNAGVPKDQFWDPPLSSLY